MTKRDNCRFFCKLSIKIKFYIYGSNKRFLIFCEKLFDFICSKMTSDQGKNLNRSPMSIYYITVDWLIHTHDHTRPPHNQQRTCWHAGRPKSWKKRGCGCNFQSTPLTSPFKSSTGRDRCGAGRPGIEDRGLPGIPYPGHSQRQ